ncbi:unnamed protein product [Aspergillus oryzae]|uniref:Unnamed protein product n=1 Tax=Aspergillus oryzae TaxID=5062 RepID=A0AAN4YV33_ASPOZ|nr:unnamed protein product [Aspergillus oryzae]GMF87571.1 unnamed protein product [Aspergillus oryzae]GMG37203.1 unnamed protein product [Aspergillus oryzae]
MPKSNRPPYRLDKLAAFGQEHQQPCGSRKRSKDDDNLSGTTMNDHPNCTAESSVICLHSPSVEASSTGSSPILAGLGISWGSNTAASSSAPDIHLSETAKDYPAPLVPSSLRRAVSPCKSKTSAGALAYNEVPPRQVLDKAFERAGLMHNMSPPAPEHPDDPQRHTAVPGAIGQDRLSLKAGDRAARPHQPWRAMGWLARQKTDTAQSTSRADTERTRVSKPNRSTNELVSRPRTLGRLLQRLHLPWQSHRESSRPDSDSTQSNSLSRKSIEEISTCQSLSQPAPNTSTLPGARPSRTHCRSGATYPQSPPRCTAVATGWPSSGVPPRWGRNCPTHSCNLHSTAPNINASIPSAPVFPPPRRSIHELDGRSLIPRVSSAPDKSIMLRILWEVNCLEDLFSMALVNREAYQVFKENELQLMQATLWKVSPPAWELLQVSEPHWDRGLLASSRSAAASFYLRHYARNLYNLTRIKFLILDHCQTVLRPDTISELRDPYSRLDTVDAAIYRVWTFCQLFGCQKGREWDIDGQIRWLRGDTVGADLPSICNTSPDANDVNNVLFIPPEGFAQGNQGPLSQSQLRDMMEIWTAMAALLDFLRDETSRARSVGVFDNAPVTAGDIQQERLMLSEFPLSAYVT